MSPECISQKTGSIKQASIVQPLLKLFKSYKNHCACSPLNNHYSGHNHHHTHRSLILILISLSAKVEILHVSSPHCIKQMAILSVSNSELFIMFWRFRWCINITRYTKWPTARRGVQSLRNKDFIIPQQTIYLIWLKQNKDFIAL